MPCGRRAFQNCAKWRWNSAVGSKKRRWAKGKGIYFSLTGCRLPKGLYTSLYQCIQPEIPRADVYLNCSMQCEKETLDCVIHEMRAVLGEKMPEEDAVRAYLKDPGKKTTLTVGQQVLAMDKLLEDAEVNFHMICDMVRYQNMKEAGMVHSVDEFLQLLRSGRTQNE